MIPDIKRVVIENIYPEIDCGRFSAKSEIGSVFEVFSDIYMDGHDTFEANLLYRKKGKKRWNKVPMNFYDNDTWKGTFVLEELGKYEYTVEAYPVIDKEIVSTYDKILEVYADRVRARYASWYEMWPRSQGTDPKKSATFDDMIKRLPEISDLGFDVVYLTPIHPIGKSFKKGKNNSLNAKAEEPGCPYCIGNEHGGHLAVEPTLGGMAGFEKFVREVKRLDMDVALDVALNCSYDHPYLKDHPEWFYRRADGTIKYAENPPKKYEDVYPLDFFTKENREGLWNEIRDMFLFWADKGVRTFRIDNPHTKPVAFWQWVIEQVQNEYPDVIFLSEAFTRPKVMKMLAKVGFTQSYTYFTWRNYKAELINYFTEITSSPVKDYMRGNLFTNTPDILPEILQKGGKAAFKMRLVLAATLSSVYGIYNGFELLENRAIEGKEEYLNSEKYEFKVWDWDRPGNIKYLVKRINKIRRENLALQAYDNLKFYYSTNAQILFYGKYNANKTNVILVVVNLDPYNKQDSMIHVPIEELGLGHSEFYEIKDLITNEMYTFRGKENYIELDPNKEPAHIFRVETLRHRETEFPTY